MTNNEIKVMAKKNNFEVFSELFKGKVPVYFCNLEEGIEDYQCDVLRMFLKLDPYFDMTIKQLLFAHCKMLNELTDYGISKTDKSHPCYGDTPGEIVNKYTGPEIVIPRQEGWKHLFCFMEFKPQWEEEHGVGVVVKDGSIMGCADYQDYYYDFQAPGRNET
jgi:hypothetical protein